MLTDKTAMHTLRHFNLSLGIQGKSSFDLRSTLIQPSVRAEPPTSDCRSRQKVEKILRHENNMPPVWFCFDNLK